MDAAGPGQPDGEQQTRACPLRSGVTTRWPYRDEKWWQDYVYWQTQDRKTFKRISQVIADMLRDPFTGIGKAEPLRHVLTGAWSRRIDETNRLVYYVTDDHIVVLQAREHY